MNFISNFISDWKAKRVAEAATKAELLAQFDAFVRETRPLTPKAKVYPEAALYRQVWKRAVVLEQLALTAGDEVNTRLYQQFQYLARKEYFSVAPDGPYGKVRLSLSEVGSRKIRDHELVRIQYAANPLRPRKSRGVVYLLKSGQNYKIGRSNDFNRRFEEIKLQLPDPVTTRHIIYTDDPVRLEQYWHDKFSYRRKNGEWFGLSDSDVKEFTKHEQT